MKAISDYIMNMLGIKLLNERNIRNDFGLKLLNINNLKMCQEQSRKIKAIILVSFEIEADA